MNPTLRLVSIIIIGIGVATAFFWTGLTLRPKAAVGTGPLVIEKYNSVPPGFPAGIIPTGLPLQYSQITTQAKQRTWAVAVQSTLSMPAQMSALLDSLKNAGWEVKEQRISASGFIEAEKNGERLSVTVSAQENQTGLLVMVLTYGPLAIQ